MVEAIATELVLQKNYLPSPQLTTVYLGGGTPSLLTEVELAHLFAVLHRHYQIDPEAEITLEANPDDLSVEKLQLLRRLGVNRLSIGVQTFQAEQLHYLHRAHDADQATRAIQTAQDLGFEALSVDLIYALPSPDHELLRQDLTQLISFGVPHISAYCLTIEPKTVFGYRVTQKKMKAVDDEYASEQFGVVVETLAQHGYEQYEISNFAKEERYSRHNTAYWQRKPYLGVGPSAHSYNGRSRQYNRAHNADYLKAIAQGGVSATVEELSSIDEVNEYLLTGLRTKWGCRLDLLAELSGGGFETTMKATLDEFHRQGWMMTHNQTLLLTAAGKLFADRIASELFLD